MALLEIFPFPGGGLPPHAPLMVSRRLAADAFCLAWAGCTGQHARQIHAESGLYSGPASVGRRWGFRACGLRRPPRARPKKITLVLIWRCRRPGHSWA